LKILRNRTRRKNRQHNRNREDQSLEMNHFHNPESMVKVSRKTLRV
jgi:hypothetical protein